MDKSPNHSNIHALLEEATTIELLLDLLENEDMTVGVMTSQILSHIHSRTPSLLEDAIQQCPNGAFPFPFPSIYPHSSLINLHMTFK